MLMVSKHLAIDLGAVEEFVLDSERVGEELVNLSSAVIFYHLST